MSRTNKSPKHARREAPFVPPEVQNDEVVLVPPETFRALESRVAETELDLMKNRRKGISARGSADTPDPRAPKEKLGAA